MRREIDVDSSAMERKAFLNKTTCVEYGGIYVPSHMRNGIHVNAYCRNPGKGFPGLYEEDYRYPVRQWK